MTKSILEQNPSSDARLDVTWPCAPSILTRRTWPEALATPGSSFARLDKYGRTIADVLLPDGTNVNHTLVKNGWCWWYRKYAPGDTVLEELERDARQGRKGMWADPQPVLSGRGGRESVEAANRGEAPRSRRAGNCG